MFLDSSSFQDKSLTMASFREWAGEVASSYINAGVPPQETLVKIAQSEELTPHQIEVLAGEINKEIHKHKFASVNDKYFAADFPLADAKAAVNSLQADGGEEKISSALPEPRFTRQAPDMHAMFGVAHEELDKTASLKKELKFASVRGELLDQKLEDKMLVTKYAAEASEAKFIKMARQYVLGQDTSSTRMKALGTLEHFVKQSGLNEGRRSLAKLAYVLGKEGLLTGTHTKLAFTYLAKEADQKAPEELISETLPAQIVNGEHPLYITLKTFRDHKNALEDYDNKHKLIHDRLNVVKQKVRAL